MEIEVFLEENNKAIQGDLLDSWIFREKHDQGNTVQIQWEIQCIYSSVKWKYSAIELQ